MTEQTNTNEATEEARGAKLCQSGSMADKPCYRAATEKAFDETAPKRCPEHQRVYDEGLRMDGYLYAVEKVGAFLKSADVDDDPFGELFNLVQEWHDHVRDCAANAARETAVAKLIANARPPEPGDPMTAFEREERAGSIVDSDALGLAWSTLASEERDVGEAERFVMLAALANTRGRLRTDQLA